MYKSFIYNTKLPGKPFQSQVFSLKWVIQIKGDFTNKSIISLLNLRMLIKKQRTSELVALILSIQVLIGCKSYWYSNKYYNKVLRS